MFGQLSQGSPFDMGLVDRVVLLTGGTSGIGRALSEGLRQRGCNVVELDRSSDPSTATSQISTPGQLVRVVGDVCDPDVNSRAVDVALAEFGRLDAFVGNAGVHDGGVRVGDISAHELAELTRRVLDVNVVGYLLGASAAVGPVSAAGGTMVFTLSDASFVVSGTGAGIAYVASKHAALGLVRALASQLAPRVRVNAVAPGGIVTGLRTADSGKAGRRVFTDPEVAEAAIRDLNPLGAVLKPEDLVPHYLYLLTDQSRGLTGHVVRPDGGLSVA